MNNDLISRSEAKKLGATCLARRNENGQLEAIISLDNAPTVSLQDIYQEGHYDGHLESYTKAINEERPQGEWADYNAYYKTCSICKRTVGIDFLIQKYEDKPEGYSFCPNCGASMKVGKEE